MIIWSRLNIDFFCPFFTFKQKNAATSYFQRVTGAALRSKFQPIIQASLAKTETTRYWTDLSTKYNQIPLASKINTDLSDYATQKAMDYFMKLSRRN